MSPGSIILSLVKATPDDFLAGLKSLSNQERVEVDRKMRQLEDKHQDEFSKDSGRREQTRRGFLSTLGLGAAGVGAAVAAKLLPGSKVIGDQASKAPAAGLSDAERTELEELRAAKLAKPEPDAVNPTALYLKQRRQKFTNPTYRDDEQVLHGRNWDLENQQQEKPQDRYYYDPEFDLERYGTHPEVVQYTRFAHSPVHLNRKQMAQAINTGLDDMAEAVRRSDALWNDAERTQKLDFLRDAMDGVNADGYEGNKWKNSVAIPASRIKRMEQALAYFDEYPWHFVGSEYNLPGSPKGKMTIVDAEGLEQVIANEDHINEQASALAARIPADLQRIRNAVQKRRETFEQITGQKEEDVDFPEEMRDTLDAAEKRLLAWEPKPAKLEEDE